MRFKSLILLFILPFTVAAQMDSLWSVWEDESNHDTIRLDALKRYSWDGYIFTDPDSAYLLAGIQYDYARKTNHLIYASAALNTQATSHYIQGNLDEAILDYNRAIHLNDSIGNEKGNAPINTNLASIYMDMGNYDVAAEYYFECLEIFEADKDSARMAMIYNNLGVMYDNQTYYELAIEYHKKSLEIKERFGDVTEIVASLINIAAAYALIDSNKLSIDLNHQALSMSREVNYEKGIALCLVNLASHMVDHEQFQPALLYYHEAKSIYEKNQIEEGIVTTLIHLTEFHLNSNRLDSAKYYGIQAVERAEKLGFLEAQKNANKMLYHVYRAKGDFFQCLEAFEAYIDAKEIQNNNEFKNESIRMNYQYNYEKQSIIDSLEFKRRETLQDIEISEKEAQLDVARYQRFVLFGGIVVLLIIAFFIYRNFRIKKADNILINKQKKEVEFQRDLAEKQKKELDEQHLVLQDAHHEIQDSIRYAKRLQDAILPPLSELENKFTDLFIYNRPKDVVSGDFYWSIETKNDKVLFAVADCTGHGVPGSLVSVVCANALNRSVKEFGLINPCEILDKTRDIVIDTFSHSAGDVRDGMDIALCKIIGNKVVYSGANNAIWRISKEGNLHEYKADKQPVGKHEGNQAFNQVELEMQAGDWIYLFTDGFVDQFGGEFNKKYKRSQFKTFLQSIHLKSGIEQQEALNKELEAWKGDQEQIDDICVVGIRF